ncbi:hypothetical protein CHS0354_004128 [Potamilus streckersoni]|uniref:Large ribosomal subunit protein mL64 n=1 Tax=Potamilus streckersoni TaxID=2493646 RepID=A0AAE0SJ72_9BIVA|nr:hypothetical protein CHS0354_004128 [Potamilus streckersoni]
MGALIRKEVLTVTIKTATTTMAAALYLLVRREHSLLNISTCHVLISKIFGKALSVASTETNLESSQPENKPKVEDEIANIRNVSNLPQRLRAKLSHVNEMPDLNDDKIQNNTRILRKIYAKYGKSSGIDPRIMWPLRSELKVIKEDERDWDPTFQDLVDKMKQKKLAEQKEKKEREERVAKNMAMMPKWIAEYHKREAAKQLAQNEQEKKKQKLLDEARDYYGYSITPQDPKFRQMIEEKALEEKKAKKAMKKQQKTERAQAFLQKQLEQKAKEEEEEEEEEEEKKNK